MTMIADGSTVTRVCAWDGCDETFTYIRGHGRPKLRCDTHARAARNGKPVTVMCPNCGTDFIAASNRIKRYGKVYCSRECMGASYSGPTKPKPTPTDRRSPLRRALEDGGDVIAAIARDCNIDEAGCWNWTRRLSADGYPEVRVGDRYLAVHRLSLEARLGAPLGKQPAHHKCANSACVNPEHLQPVTHAQNSAEMMARNYMVARIKELEAALRDIVPDHPALNEISIPSSNISSN